MQSNERRQTMMKRTIAVAAFALLLAGAAFAQQATDSGNSLERRIERIEQAIARIEKRLSASSDGMMEGCRGMMGEGMMGGGRGSPNNQWGGSGSR
jgi:hypothetical protein